MKCPRCQSTDLKVIETRETHDFLTRRRRLCNSCNERFTTYENIETSNILVQKKNKKLEAYDPEKLKSGLLRAGHKRHLVIKHIPIILDKTEKMLLEYEKDTVPSSYIGDIVLEQLKDIDHIAYIRFASVYKEFSNVGEFINIIEDCNIKVTK